MTSSIPLFCNQHLTVRNKKVMYLGLIWECGTYALTNLFKIPFWVTTITEPDKGQSAKTKPYGQNTYGTRLPFSTIQDCTYIQCNKNKIYVFDPYGEPNTWNVSWEQKLWNWHWWKCFFQLSATFILSGDVTAFMQGNCKHIKCDTV